MSPFFFGGGVPVIFENALTFVFQVCLIGFWPGKGGGWQCPLTPTDGPHTGVSSNINTPKNNTNTVSSSRTTHDPQITPACDRYGSLEKQENEQSLLSDCSRSKWCEGNCSDKRILFLWYFCLYLCRVVLRCCSLDGLSLPWPAKDQRNLQWLGN